MTPARAASWMVVASVLAACGGGGAGGGSTTPVPVAGSLRVHLTDPSTGDAAILLRVTGPVASGNVVSLLSGVRLEQRAAPGQVTIAIFGPISSGDVARFDVPDVDKVGEYSATVLDAADETNALRKSLGGYSVSVVK